MIYVTMTDKFMSNWGESKDKINKLIFECETVEQANIVFDNATNRKDQKYIHIHYRGKPWYNSNRYHVQVKTINDYPNWYKLEAFDKV